MNRKFWSGSGPTIEMLVLKLAEETGEVSKALTDEMKEGRGLFDFHSDSLEQLTAECDDVIFLAQTIQRKVYEEKKVRERSEEFLKNRKP